MNYIKQNDELRSFYKKDFSEIKKLITRIRHSLLTGEKLEIADLTLDDIIDFKPNEYYFYISLFAEHKKTLRFGSKRSTLKKVLSRIIEKLREKECFKEFDIENPDTRILLEWIIKRQEVNIRNAHCNKSFNDTRFEPGITGIEAIIDGTVYNWMPTDSPVLNTMDLNTPLAKLANRAGITKGKKLKISEKAKLLKHYKDAKFYFTESRAVVSYKDSCIPLYRGNILYDEFSFDTLIDIFSNGTKWLVDNMLEDGRFTYYYDCTCDNNIDHEHPSRRPPDLYYNDLRHCGGGISLIHAYNYTNDEKFLIAAKKAIDWTIAQTRFHDIEGKEAAYVYANKKVKLGGVGIPLVMLMRYREASKDTSYDRYIEGYARHLISRLTPDGEFMGYYIHPSFHNGEPLDTMTDEERKTMFSFYYPGEALLGLALVATEYDKNEELKQKVIEKSKLAMDWIINKRPELYADLFTELPSDAWLMQAIEQWAKLEGFLDQEAIDFVFNDADILIEKSYKKNDSPYIDFEGGMYYDYGDHYFPDGARCEGLVAAAYLAHYLKKDELAFKYFEACKKAAHTQFQLAINEYNNFAHLNPKKSAGGIKFKVTRQWLRVDSIQHVVCFFKRLYNAQGLIESLKTTKTKNKFARIKNLAKSYKN